MVAKDIGFEYSDGELMRLVETLASKMDPRGNWSEGDQAEQVAGQDEQDDVSQKVAENQSEHYALFAGNDW
ncbi:hypothetical protein Hanom_Chr16g01461651 [Helianthus anomalus]